MNGRRALLTYLARRVGAAVAVLLVLSFVVFSLLYLAPGSAVHALLGPHRASPAVVETLRQRWHLDDPFFTQYLRWLQGAVHLDFGESMQSAEPVSRAISGRAGVTVFLAVYAFIVAVAVGVPLGVLAAWKRRGRVDRGVVAVSVLGVSAPAFVTGLALIYVFGVLLAWFPVYGPGAGFADRTWHLTLPAVALALSAMALLVKVTRAAMIGVLEQDYMAFAHARGVPVARMVIRHALRNALIPIVTAMGTLLVALITGTLIVEATFALPGLGSLLIDAVETKDVPVVQGIVMVVAFVVIAANLAIDMLYAVIDPRIRLGSAIA
jgi:peptide/nickel transport system permease protein